MDAKNLQVKDLAQIEENGFIVNVFHFPGDPDNANRIRISSSVMEVELLPSKGLSLLQAWMMGKPIFWEAPINVPNTDTINLWSGEVSINGSPAPGFTFLKTLVGGIELYGLRNWGMPSVIEGKLLPLHGETSNIPVSEVQFGVENDECFVRASFIYRTFEGNNDLPWYQRGEALFRVTKKVVLKKNAAEILLEDTIENISNRSLTPDWGYHITFRPEEGARYIVPSQTAHLRGGNALPADIQTWHKAKDESIRTETGIIHKNIKISENGLCESQLVYPDGSGIKVFTTPSLYFQTWFCCGGKGSKEFTDNAGNSLLHQNWDGMGIEIGSSPLDHDGNIDKSVNYNPELKPGEKKSIVISVNRMEYS